MAKMATATKKSQSQKDNKTKNAASKESKPKGNQNNNKPKQQTVSKPKVKSTTPTQPSTSNTIRNVALILALLGIGVSVFALYVEIMKETNPNYIAICDITSYISCSKVLTSRYSKGFGIIDQIFSKDHILNQPNPVYGIAFYLLTALLALKTTTAIALTQATLSFLANIGSIYLGYILAFVLEDACLVCITTYIINFLLLGTSMAKVRSALSSSSSSKSASKKKKK